MRKNQKTYVERAFQITIYFIFASMNIVTVVLLFRNNVKIQVD